VTIPSQKIEVDEADTVAFDANSPLDDDLHPARAEAQE
jgi:small subunit ribosomal protein S4